MKINYILLLCSTFIILGCGNEENNNKKSPIQTLTKISGVSTLGNATICIDSNSDNSCNQNETSTKSQADGSYKLETTQRLSQGTHIIAYEGDNLILLESNNTKLLLISPYDEKQRELNLNTLITLVSVVMKEGKSYDEAVEFVAQRYELDSALITQNPLETVKKENTQRHFQTINVIEERFVHKKQNKTSILRSGGFSLEPISLFEADDAFQFVAIAAINPFLYTIKLLAFISKSINNTLDLVGLTDERSDEEQLNDKYGSINKATLHPFLVKIQNNPLSNINEEDKKSFIKSLKEHKKDEKLYIDMTSIFYANIMDANLTKFVFEEDVLNKNLLFISFLGTVGDIKSTKYMIEMLHIMNLLSFSNGQYPKSYYNNDNDEFTFDKWREYTKERGKAIEKTLTAFENILDGITYNKETNKPRIENVETFADYGSSFYRKYTSKYQRRLIPKIHQIVASAIMKIGKSSAIDNILEEIVDAKYRYQDINISNDKFIQLLMNNVENHEDTIKILYQIASKISEDEIQKSEKILEYFVTIKTKRPDMQDIIEDLEGYGYLLDRRYHFYSETLQAEIKAL